MRYKYDWPRLFLRLVLARLWYPHRRANTQICLLPFVNQTAQQTLCVVVDTGSGRPERSRSIVVECEDAGVVDLERQEVFQPECLRLGMCPGLDGVPAEAVYGNYAGVESTGSVFELERRYMQRGQVRDETYSSVHVVVAPGGGYTTVSDITCNKG